MTQKPGEMPDTAPCNNLIFYNLYSAIDCASKGIAYKLCNALFWSNAAIIILPFPQGYFSTFLKTLKH